MSAPNRLSEMRRARGWAQADLAERSAVSRTEISAIETGRLVPSVAVALRLAAALDERVEALFSPPGDHADVSWAWRPQGPEDGRVWQAAIGGRVYVYPFEPTAAGAIPHDGWFDGRLVRPRTAGVPPHTLVVAGCDPIAGLLARALGADQGIRVLPLLRSSTQALDLLRRGLVHAAGVHFVDAGGAEANDAMVRATIGPGYRLIHQVRWDAGIALSGRRERSVPALLRANVRWVNREEGSGARRAFDTLLGARRRPAGYEHIVRDHRAVAATVSSGWAEAGVCCRPAAAEARLAFVPLQQEAYELCVSDASTDDPRVAALVAALQSAAYRRLLADVPGCAAGQTGDVRSVS